MGNSRSLVITTNALHTIFNYRSFLPRSTAHKCRRQNLPPMSFARALVLKQATLACTAGNFDHPAICCLLLVCWIVLYVSTRYNNELITVITTKIVIITISINDHYKHDNIMIIMTLFKKKNNYSNTNNKLIILIIQSQNNSNYDNLNNKI
jgi:hypothetical protein